MLITLSGEEPLNDFWTQPGMPLRNSKSGRLQRLFDRYNQLYWRGKLPAYRVLDSKLESALGDCDWSRRRIIKIDVQAHASNRELRSTVLHEMCHAAAQERGSRGHDLKFFAQVERLLEKGAPITVNDPEAGGVHILRGLVPSRFPLLKSKIERLERRRTRPLEKSFASRPDLVRNVSNDAIIQEFEDAASELSWRRALIRVGLQYGLTDETERPLNSRASGILARARKIHARARQNYLQLRKFER